MSSSAASTSGEVERISSLNGTCVADSSKNETNPDPTSPPRVPLNPPSPISEPSFQKSPKLLPTSLDKVDLLLGWKNIQAESRYAYTAPSSEAMLAFVASIRGTTAVTSQNISGSVISGQPENVQQHDVTNPLEGLNHQVANAQPSVSPPKPIQSPQFSARSPDTISIESSDHDNAFSQGMRSDWESSFFRKPCEELLTEGLLVQIVEQVRRKFGFQQDTASNTVEVLMSLVDSRSSRVSCLSAITSIHKDYISGQHSNFGTWYMCHASVEEIIELKQATINARDLSDTNDQISGDPGSADLEAFAGEDALRESWRQYVSSLSYADCLKQVALYHMIWTESSNIRMMSEYSETETASFMRTAIVPLYEFLRSQNWEVVGSKLIQKEKDHNRVIGYDDINELFWSPTKVQNISLKSGQRLKDIPVAEQFRNLGNLEWKKAFSKTFKETRTVLHLLVNFSRIWILHIGFFFSYLAWVTAPIYSKEIDAISTAAAVGTTPDLLPTREGIHLVLPTSRTFDDKGAPNLQLALTGSGGAAAVLFALVCTILEAVYLPLRFKTWSYVFQRLSILVLLLLVNLGPLAYVLMISKKNSIAKALSVIQIVISGLTILMLATVPPQRLVWRRRSSSDRFNGEEVFSRNIAPLKPTERWMSIAIWTTIFVSKFAESLFFVVMPVGRPLKVLIQMPLSQCGKVLLLCRVTLWSSVFLIFLCVFVLFFLDTYMWWLVWSTVFGVIRALFIGLSILTPWRNIFIRLPERIYTKLLATSEMSVKQRPKLLCAQLWNSVIISMAQDHLLSLENIDKLLYREHPTEGDSTRSRIEKPKFFSAQEDTSTKMEFFPAGSEAERRITFFAQSLYLKSLHPYEWQNFVKDTKVASGFMDTVDEAYHIPLQAVGFKDQSPEAILRTRIWASLRSQTLYRTVSGFMNYQKALKLLARIENPQIVASMAPERLNAALDHLACQKFTLVVAMQRYTRFDKEEMENVELLLRFYPSVKIAYVEELPIDVGSGVGKYFSCLIDGTCNVRPNGLRVPKFRIELPGPPFLGDGKSDNQNCTIIWTRGEFIQLVDANQDHYLEEALKVRSILAEFETNKPHDGTNNSEPPVAIVGAREFIFSERIGVLGDVAAGKISSGVSKAQKGLSVNEDIFAGMNALQRGGRIKHTEYMQCGKGRDLGFSSILKFVAKIGAGMGEQILSREHYRLGTTLPLDRLLTFYYGHPGFHINNVFIMCSVQLMILVLFMIVAMKLSFSGCFPRTILDNPSLPPMPEGCADMDALFDWVKQAVFSIVAVFAISFLPLFLQVLAEQGIISAVKRILKHVVSLSPLFDVFTTQIYSYTLLYDLNFGRAGYIASGRGFATARKSFSSLYQAFAEPSIYFGMRLLVILLAVSNLNGFGHLAFFWIMVLPLIIAPYLFNPHQFRPAELILDYGQLLKWFSAGNSFSPTARNTNWGDKKDEEILAELDGEESWIRFHRQSRAQFTGHRRSGQGSAQSGLTRAKFSVIFFQELIVPLFLAVITVAAYGLTGKSIKTAIIIAGLAILPLVLNMGFLLIMLPISLIFGPIVSMCDRGGFGKTSASIAHIFSVITAAISYLIAALMSQKSDKS
ncbi:1,3-beta-D-glucan synthase [Blyttiomyces sp. JEL0837]|nr:1,3-beta-D-glucan synthase [Blyttiomyces sp. JEL0837]